MAVLAVVLLGKGADPPVAEQGADRLRTVDTPPVLKIGIISKRQGFLRADNYHNGARQVLDAYNYNLDTAVL